MPIEFKQEPEAGSSFLDPLSIAQDEEHSFADVTRAAFEQENDVVALIGAMSRPEFEPVEDYNSLDDIEGTIYEQYYSDSFVHSYSPNETEYLKAKIDKEINNARILADSGLKGTTMAITAGLLSPVTLLPGGSVVRGIRTGQIAMRTGRNTAISAGTGVALQEAALQANQETRTAEQSVISIGTGAVVGGILGGGVGLLSQVEQKAISKKLEDLQSIMEGAEDVYSGIGNSSAGASQRDTRKSVLKNEQIIKKLPGINQQDPTIRLKLAPSTVSRRAINDLAENPLENMENANFIASSKGGSVEARMKVWQGPLAKSISGLSDNFSKYFYGLQTGRIRKSLAPISSELSRSQRLTYTQFKEEVGKALRRGDAHEIPEVAETARLFRQELFETGKAKAIRAGLFDEGVDVSTSHSYLTRVYNKELIQARRADFKAILSRHFEAGRNQALAEIDELSAQGKKLDDKLKAFAEHSDLEIDRIVDDVIDRILGNHQGRMDYAIVQGERGPLNERVLNISDYEIEDFLESDVEMIARQYTRTMSADVELVEKFGEVDLENKLAQIREDYNTQISSATTEKQRIGLQKRKEADLRDIAAVRDRLRGTYGLPDNPSGLLVRSGRVVRSLNYMRLLGGMTISAIPDLAKPIFVHGMRRSIQSGIIPILRDIKAFKASAEEVKLAGTALDMVLDTRVMSIADLMDNYGKQSKFERFLSASSSRFGLVSLMAPWNATLKQISGNIVLTRMLKAMTEGSISASDTKLLAASGIDGELASRISAQFKQHGSIDGGLYVPNTLAWTDNEAVSALRAALVRDVDRVVVTPGQDKPLWMSNEIGAMIGQFKSFGVASIQRTLLAGIQQNDAATYSGVALMLMLGAVTHALKEKVAGRDISDEPNVIVANALDRSGLLGWLSDANNILEKGSGGMVGLSAITGERISRYQSRNVYGAFLGPTADAVADVFQVSSGLSRGELSESDLSRVKRLIPFQNLFHLRLILNEVEGE